jgi:hypothetical protein
MVTCLASYQPTGGQTGLKHQPACRQAGEVTLVPVRLRLWVQRLAVMQAFFIFYDYLLFNPQPDKISFAVQLGELWTVVC